MAYEHLWENEHFRKAFQRWWDEDWSWEGLGKRGRKRFIGYTSQLLSGSLQDAWSDEEHRLIDFAGRKWTRFHLPPVDRDGNPCPDTIWYAAKDGDFSLLFSKCNDTSPALSDAALEGEGSSPVGFADLSGVIFPEEVGGDSPRIALDSAVFLGAVDISGMVQASFLDVTFAGEAFFSGVTFSGDAYFDGAKFLGGAWFNKVIFQRNARFNCAIFLEGARFDSAEVRGEAWFNRATFVDGVVFHGTTFALLAEFDDATFSREVSFLGATFRGDVRFRNAAFWGNAWFLGAQPFMNGVSFARARFTRRADFSDREFRARTDFTGTEFNGVAAFGNVTLHDDTSFHDAKFADIEGIQKEGNAVVEDYERAYRRLRLLCRDIGNVEYEGMFHALELKAHRARTDAQFMARMAIWLYDWMSDFGSSLTRPILSLLLFWLLFALVYGAVFLPSLRVGHACGDIDGPAPAAFLATIGHGFLPSLFGGNRVADLPGWLHCAQEADPLGYFLISVMQNVSFIACLSLFLIALRRRFQLRE